MLRFESRPATTSARQPLRVVQFANGDRLTAEVLETSRQATVLRVFGRVRWRIPTAAIASIAMRAGERQLLAFDVIDGAPPSAANASDRWLIPQAEGELTCRIGLESIDDRSSVPAGLVADFSSGDRIAISVDPAGRWFTSQSPTAEDATRQGAEAKDRGRCEFRLQTTSERIYVSVDGRLLLSDSQPRGQLQSIEVVPGKKDRADQPVPARITYLSVIERRRESPGFPAPRDDLDAVVSVDGDVWWGEFRKLSFASVNWTADGHEWSRAAADVSGVILRQPPETNSARKLVGRIVKLELQPSADRLDLPGDRLTGLLCGAGDGWLHVEHPLGGRLAIPREVVRTIETDYVGESRILASGETGRPRGKPGLHLARNFSLDRLPDGDATISVEVSGLEPSGPRTPPGSPWLKALRAGFGSLEVQVNGERLGTLNDLTSRWTRPGEFVVLRTRIPVRLLKMGENSWSIQETAAPTRSTSSGYRLRTVTLELPARLP